MTTLSSAHCREPGFSTTGRRCGQGRASTRGRIDACAAGIAIALALGGCGGGGGNVAAPSFTVAAAGDIAQCFDAPAAASAAAKTAALVNREDAVVLTIGDNAYENGTPEEFANCFNPTWGAFKGRIRPGIGNHDTYTPNSEGYFGYFGAQAGPDRSGYYSFDYGGWHFISLNSSTDVSAQSAQYQWLVADLAKSRSTLCTIAYWHYPLFNSGANHGVSPEMKPFFEALYNAGVEIVLSGHEHVYERFAQQMASGVGDPTRGIRQFVVGTGGHALDKFGPPMPNSEVRVEGVWGVLRLTLNEGSYSWQFMPAGGGATLDSGRDTCHR
jgi:hypothetical protein